MGQAESITIGERGGWLKKLYSLPVEMGLKRFRGSRWVPFLLSSPLILLLVILYFFPVCYMISMAFFKKIGFGGIEYILTLNNFVRFFTDSWYLDLLWRTIRISLLATIMTTILGYIIAYFLVFYESRLKELYLILVVSPVLVGNVIRAFGWRVLISDSGAINDILLGSGIIQEPIHFLYTEHGVIIAISSVLLPLVIMVLLGALNNIEVSLLEAAKSLGADKIKTFLYVTLPLSLPGIAAAIIICFILALGTFETAVFIGGQKVPMIGPIVYEQIAKVFNWPFGAAITVVVLVVALVTAYLSNKMLKYEYK